MFFFSVTLDLTSDELNPNATSNLKFFSRETNTIYSPYIDVQWPDFTFDTGSLSPITSSLGVSISIKNLKKEYKSGSKVKFTVFAREQNPKKQFTSFQTSYLTPKYLPTSSFYSIKDNESEEYIEHYKEEKKYQELKKWLQSFEESQMFKDVMKKN